MHIVYPNTFSYRKSVLRRDNVLLKLSENLHITYAAMMHPGEGLCLIALLTLKVENSLICLAGTRILNGIQGGMAIYFALEDVNKK
jgi:hypothetical protein